jgi:SAM-dependent methyltransferase
MDHVTIQFYDDHAASIGTRYESADVTALHRLLLRYLPEDGRVLEIGCGSGRDAAFLAGKGFDVTATDASSTMIAAAREAHPELDGRLLYAVFPFAEPPTQMEPPYDAAVALATLMHIPEHDLFECASQLRDLLAPGATLLISVSTGRDDVEDNRTPDGRLFIERPPDEIQLLFERVGFRQIAQHQNEDAFGRGVQWHTLVMQRARGRTTHAVDEIETIITRDKKVATYKLALLRALCEIAQTESHMAKWRPDERVEVPLGLVAEKWLLYYWPIVELDVVTDSWAVMPQTQGMEQKKPIAFRRPLRDLIRFYLAHGGLSGFYHDYKSGTVPAAGVALLDDAINTIARTIVAGPVTYAGGALDDVGSYFGFEGRRSAKNRCISPGSTCGRLGRIIVPATTWREMCLIGHWVAESLVLRWAELTYRLSNKTVPVKDVVERLLIIPETERDVHFARSVYQGIDNLRCVWTDAALKKEFAVDHTVPFSIWHNNDLWNLLPSAPKANGAKSDKLVTKQLLFKQRDPIIHYWEVLKTAAEIRFYTEIDRSLVRGSYSPQNWQQPAFAGLVENVESLALQRGLERWEP